MPVQGQRKDPPARRGPRVSATAQLGRVARRLLLELLREERRLSEGSHVDRQALRNEGIPWNLPVMAERVGALPPAVSRALAGLEERRVIACWAAGQPRRIRSVKLSADAVAVALAEEQHPGVTREGHRRAALREHLTERNQDWTEDG